MWSPFSRASQVPGDVLTRARLERGEKPLAAAAAQGGTWLIATRDALVTVEADAVLRLLWQQVESAEWSRDDDRLRISEVGEYGRPRPVHVHVLDDPGDLLAVVRERVTASVILQRRVTVRGRQGLTVVARRAPSGGGDVTWVYELDPGLDPDDATVRDLAERGVATAAEELGLR